MLRCYAIGAVRRSPLGTEASVLDVDNLGGITVAQRIELVRTCRHEAHAEHTTVVGLNLGSVRHASRHNVDVAQVLPVGRHIRAGRARHVADLVRRRRGSERRQRGERHVRTGGRRRAARAQRGLGSGHSRGSNEGLTTAVSLGPRRLVLAPRERDVLVPGRLRASGGAVAPTSAGEHKLDEILVEVDRATSDGNVAVLAGVHGRDAASRATKRERVRGAGGDEEGVGGTVPDVLNLDPVGGLRLVAQAVGGERRRQRRGDRQEGNGALRGVVGNVRAISRGVDVKVGVRALVRAINRGDLVRVASGRRRRRHGTAQAVQTEVPVRLGSVEVLENKLFAVRSRGADGDVAVHGHVVRRHVGDETHNITGAVAVVAVNVERLRVQVRKTAEEELAPRALAGIEESKVHRGCDARVEVPGARHERVAHIRGVLQLHPRLLEVLEANAVVVPGRGQGRGHAHVEGHLVAGRCGVIGLAEAGSARAGEAAANFALGETGLRRERLRDTGVSVAAGRVLDDLDGGADNRGGANEVVVLGGQRLLGVTHTKGAPRRGLAVVNMVRVVEGRSGHGLEVVGTRRGLDRTPVVRAGDAVAHVPTVTNREAHVRPRGRDCGCRGDCPRGDGGAGIRTKVGTGSDTIVVRIRHAARRCGRAGVAVPGGSRAARRQHTRVDAVETLVVVTVVVVEAVPATATARGCGQGESCALVGLALHGEHGLLAGGAECARCRANVKAVDGRVRLGRRHRCLEGRCLEARTGRVHVHVTVRDGARREARCADEAELVTTDRRVVGACGTVLPSRGHAVVLRRSAGGVVHLDGAPSAGVVMVRRPAEGIGVGGHDETARREATDLARGDTGVRAGRVRLEDLAEQGYVRLVHTSATTVEAAAAGAEADVVRTDSRQVQVGNEVLASSHLSVRQATGRARLTERVVLARTNAGDAVLHGALRGTVAKANHGVQVTVHQNVVAAAVLVLLRLLIVRARETGGHKLEHVASREVCRRGHLECVAEAVLHNADSGKVTRVHHRGGVPEVLGGVTHLVHSLVLVVELGPRQRRRRRVGRERRVDDVDVSRAVDTDDSRCDADAVGEGRHGERDGALRHKHVTENVRRRRKTPELSPVVGVRLAAHDSAGGGTAAVGGDDAHAGTHRAASRGVDKELVLAGQDRALQHHLQTEAGIHTGRQHRHVVGVHGTRVAHADAKCLKREGIKSGGATVCASALQQGAHDDESDK
eukprot:PhM_4_TR3082/c0_g1_i1/m.53984